MAEDSRLLGEGIHLRLLVHKGWEYLERTQARYAVVIVALTHDGKLVLVEQYRPPVQSRVIELPAGLVGDVPQEGMDDAREAARRELLEETGYDAAELEYLTEGPPSPGLSNELVIFFRARQLRRSGAGGGVEGEQITVHEVPLLQAEAWLDKRRRAGIMIDPKTYAGLFFALKS